MMRPLKTLKVIFSSDDQHVSSAVSCVYFSSVECNIDGGVRFAANGADFGHIQGDVVGIILVCEAGLWKNIVLCEEEWTRENTVVTCRQLGYAAEGWFHFTELMTVTI